MRRFLPIAVTAVSVAMLAGCLDLKPKTAPVRHFLLAPTATPEPGWSASATNVALGVWPVSIPTYLNDSRLALRRGSQEVVYQDFYLWSGRLDQNIQHVIGQNLMSLLGSDAIYLSVWRPELVKGEVAIEIERLDVDEHGTVRLAAFWRLTGRNGAPTLGSGISRIEKPGSTLPGSPDDAVARMNAALTDLSREIAQAAQAHFSR